MRIVYKQCTLLIAHCTIQTKKYTGHTHTGNCTLPITHYTLQRSSKHALAYSTLTKSSTERIFELVKIFRRPTVLPRHDSQTSPSPALRVPPKDCVQRTRQQWMSAISVTRSVCLMTPAKTPRSPAVIKCGGREDSSSSPGRRFT